MFIVFTIIFVLLGAATMRIAMPAHMQSSLIFHYNLKFYDTEGDGFDGVSLKRFVMQVRASSIGLPRQRSIHTILLKYSMLVGGRQRGVVPRARAL